RKVVLFQSRAPTRGGLVTGDSRPPSTLDTSASRRRKSLENQHLRPREVSKGVRHFIDTSPAGRDLPLALYSKMTCVAGGKANTVTYIHARTPGRSMVLLLAVIEP